jgi:hypothetical protein
MSYAMIYGFRWLEHRWSGHLRAMPGTQKPAGPAIAVEPVTR